MIRTRIQTYRNVTSLCSLSRRAGEGGGRSGGFESRATSPLSGSGLQAAARTAGEGGSEAANDPSPQPSPRKRGEGATQPISRAP